MAFGFLAPILTPAALRSVENDPSPVITLILVIVGLSLHGVLCWFTHYVTEKSYPKKQDPNKKKKGFLGFGKK